MAEFSPDSAAMARRVRPEKPFSTRTRCAACRMLRAGGDMPLRGSEAAADGAVVEAFDGAAALAAWPLRSARSAGVTPGTLRSVEFNHLID